MSGFNEEEAQQAVALFGDVAEALGVAAGTFFGVEAAASGDGLMRIGKGAPAGSTCGRNRSGLYLRCWQSPIYHPYEQD